MAHAVWIVCCEAPYAGVARTALRAREHDARLIFLTSLYELIKTASALLPFASGALIWNSGTNELDEGIAQLVREGWKLPVIVCEQKIDPARAARLFYAGATEVIAAQDDRAEDRQQGLAYTKWGCATQTPLVEQSCDDLIEPQLDASSISDETIDAQKIECMQNKVVATIDTPPTALKMGEACVKKTVARQGELLARSPQEPTIKETGTAPVVTAISGCGGCGKSTLIASMAWCAAHMGLKTAVVDLDLMFGNLPTIMGAQEHRDLAQLGEGENINYEALVEACAMKLSYGLTLWGPCVEPERAELLSQPLEQLIALLRNEADVVFCDTSVHWSDAVAMAVAQCDRCLVVGTPVAPAGEAAVRAIGLASRVGLPKTRMTSVLTRVGQRGKDEEAAMRFEMDVALRSHVRISDGGPQLVSLLTLGHLDEAMSSSNAFVTDVTKTTRELLLELGCDIQNLSAPAPPPAPRIRLPWQKQAQEAL